MNFNKLLQIQTKLNAPKTQYNSFAKYYYRNAEDILKGLKPLLEATGSCVHLTDDIRMVGTRFYVVATASLIDAETGEVIATSQGWAREVEAKKGADESQITGAASSYARKYALNGLFAIDDEKDADAMDNREQGSMQTSPKTASNAPQSAEKKPGKNLYKLGEFLGDNGINADYFAKLMYNKTFKAMTEDEAAFCLKDTQYTVEEFVKRDAMSNHG